MSGKLGTPFERFQTKFRVCKKTGCWLWAAGLNDKGYGIFYFPPQNMIGAHIASWRLHCGEPHGLHVLHTCDTPRCVNPHHLYLGTHQDNMRDRDSRGRQYDRRGSKNGRARLTEKQVNDIRSDKRSPIEIARARKIHPSTVRNVLLRKTRKHLP